MQTVLFEKPSVVSESQRIIGYLKKRKCKIVKDLGSYLSRSFSSHDEVFHYNAVTDNMHQDRYYTELFGVISDSHNEIEKLGVCNYTKKYITIISLEDSLDYILHRLSGCSIESVRSIPEYSTVSRGILKLNFDHLSDFSFKIFSEADPKLAEYLLNLCDDMEFEDPQEQQDNFVVTLLKNILQEADTISTYVAVNLNMCKGSGEPVIRSKSFCNYILTSDLDLTQTIDLISPEQENYPLKVLSFLPYEYGSRMTEKYVDLGG